MELTNVPIKGIFLIPRYNYLGSIYKDRNDYNLALHCFKNAVEYAKNEDSYSKTSKLLISMNYIQILMDLSHYDEGIDACNNLIAEIQEANLSSVELNLFLKNVYEIEGNIYAQKANYSSDSRFLKLSIQCLENAVKRTDALMKMDSDRFLTDSVSVIANLAISYFDSNQMESSYNYFVRAEELLTKSGRSDLPVLEYLAQIKMSIGTLLSDRIEEDKSFFEQALNELKDSCSIYSGLYERDKLRFSIPFGDAVYYLARLLRQTSLTDVSIKYFQMALELLKDDETKLARCLSALGLTYKIIGDYENMRKVLNQSISLYEKLYKDTSLPYYKEKVFAIQEVLNNQY